jgi:hypothetical protein
MSCDFAVQVVRTPLIVPATAAAAAAAHEDISRDSLQVNDELPAFYLQVLMIGKVYRVSFGALQ